MFLLRISSFVDVTDKRVRAAVAYAGIFFAAAMPLLILNLFIIGEVNRVNEKIYELSENKYAAERLAASLNEKKKELSFLTEELERLTIQGSETSPTDILLDFSRLASEKGVKVKSSSQNRMPEENGYPQIKRYVFSVTFEGRLADIINVMRNFEGSENKIISVSLDGRVPPDPSYAEQSPGEGNVLNLGSVDSVEVTVIMRHTETGGFLDAEV